MTAEANERLGRRLLQAFTTGDWDPEVCAPDATSWHNHDQVEAPLAEGAAQLGSLRALVPDLRPEGLRVRGFDGGFVAELTWTGTVAGDGAGLRAPVCIVATVDDGVITSVREYLDTGHFAALFAAAAGASTG